VHDVALRAVAQDHASRREDRLKQQAAFSPAPQTLHFRLREATRAAHERLEFALNLLEAPIPADRIVHLLERFHGFHAALEPALHRIVPEPLLRPRLRLALLEQDLQCLGIDRQRLPALPVCRAAAELCKSEADAAGVLYVLEGSTLGGRIISRSLQACPWYPPQPLRYWDPYGSETGRRWSETLAYLQSLAPTGSDAVIRSAIATFDLLQAWLPLKPERGGPP